MLDTFRPLKIDVWALGATVFNAFQGRFPLIEKNEDVPRISTQQEREKFEKILADRVNNEWEKYVNINEIPEPLKDVLSIALDKDPATRCTAEKLLEKAQKHLSAFLRHSSDIDRFSPMEELEMLSKLLPDTKVLSMMPVDEKHRFVGRLNNLKEKKGLEEEYKVKAEQLLKRITG